MHIYYVYILTDSSRTMVYTGVTNNIRRRLSEHRESTDSTFCGRHRIWYLVHLETFQWIQDAIRREKYIKGKKRAWKNALVETRNPNWEFLEPP